jgi:hypothetical protein
VRNNITEKDITVELVIEAFERVMQAAAAEGRRLALRQVERPSMRTDQFLDLRRVVTDTLHAFQHAMITLHTDKAVASYYQLKQYEHALLTARSRDGVDGGDDEAADA